MAAITALGSTTVAENDFALVGVDPPPGRLGLFFYGPDQVNVPLGSGTRCVGGSIKRLRPAFNVDALGSAVHVVDFGEPPAVTDLLPGVTMNFLLWFRGQGNTTNLSDAVEVTFQSKRTVRVHERAHDLRLAGALHVRESAEEQGAGVVFRTSCNRTTFLSICCGSA